MNKIMWSSSIQPE